MNRKEKKQFIKEQRSSLKVLKEICRLRGETVTDFLKAAHEAYNVKTGKFDIKK